MTGITLSTPQFAYLLATVSAENVLGIKAPELFPKGDKAQKKVYQQGLDELIADDWIEEDKEEEGTFHFDSALLEMVAIIGAPEQFVAIINHEGETKNLLLNYLVGDQIVQLAAINDDEFSLGFVPAAQEIAQRLSELTSVGDAATGEEFSLPTKLFGQMQRASKSFSKKVGESLAAEGINDDSIDQLETAFTGGQRSEIVMASLEGGEVSHGRRAWIYGAGENAWLFHLEAAGAKEVSVVNCDRSQVEAWIENNLAELE